MRYIEIFIIACYIAHVVYLQWYAHAGVLSCVVAIYLAISFWPKPPPTPVEEIKLHVAELVHKSNMVLRETFNIYPDDSLELVKNQKSVTNFLRKPFY
jgi:hypothetical protein